MVTWTPRNFQGLQWNIKIFLYYRPKTWQNWPPFAIFSRFGLNILPIMNKKWVRLLNLGIFFNWRGCWQHICILFWISLWSDRKSPFWHEAISIFKLLLHFPAPKIKYKYDKCTIKTWKQGQLHQNNKKIVFKCKNVGFSGMSGSVTWQSKMAAPLKRVYNSIQQINEDFRLYFLFIVLNGHDLLKHIDLNISRC